MEAFVRVKAVAAIIDGPNIDTDQIIPGRFLKADRSKGYGGFLFHDLRFKEDGAIDTGFVLNREPYLKASILVTEENFGCGSSREGAVYALQDFGVRALIGTSFGDIFYNNCLKNGIVPVRLPAQHVEDLRRQLRNGAASQIEVDLERLCVVFPDGSARSFVIDPFWRSCLLQGVDDLELTLKYRADIERFVKAMSGPIRGLYRKGFPREYSDLLYRRAEVPTLIWHAGVRSLLASS